MEQIVIDTEFDCLFSDFLGSLAYYFTRSETIIHHLDCIKLVTTRHSKCVGI